MKSFFSVSGPDDALVYTPGHERIPDNFYKRNPAVMYTSLDFGSDVGYIYNMHEEDLAFGGNTGAVNTFTPINVENVTVSPDSHSKVTADRKLYILIYLLR